MIDHHFLAIDHKQISVKGLKPYYFFRSALFKV